MSTVVIVGASRGIGLRLTEEFLQHQHTVIALARNTSVEGLAGLQREYSRTLILRQADVTSEKSLHAAAKDTECVDILINNAGVLLEQQAPAVENSSVDELLQTLNVNTAGPLRCVKAFAPALRKAASTSAPAKIINITSIMGSLAVVDDMNAPRSYSYSVSKAALNMLSRLLRLQLTRENVLVHVFHPGWVRTDMGGPRASYSVEQSAQGLYTQITALTKNSPEFLDFQGNELPW